MNSVEPADQLRLLSEESSAILALAELEMRIRAMLKILVDEGRITPMGARLLIRVLDQ